MKYQYVPQALWVHACYSGTRRFNQSKFPRAPATGFNISVGSQHGVTETRDIAGFSWDLWPEDIEAMTFTGVVGAHQGLATNLSLPSS